MEGGGGIARGDECITELDDVVLLLFLCLELLFVGWALAVCVIGLFGVETCPVDSMSFIKTRGRIMPYSWVIKSLKSMLSASPVDRYQGRLNIKDNQPAPAPPIIVTDEYGWQGG